MRHSAVVYLLSAVLCLLLCACGAQPAAPAEPAAEAPAATEEPTAPATPEPPAEILIAGRSFPADTETLDLSGCDCPAEELFAALEGFPSLRGIELGLTGLSGEELSRLREACPDVQLHWQAALAGMTCDNDTESLDLGALTAEELDEACTALSRLPALRSVNLIPGDGGPSALSPEEIDRLAAAAPQADFACCFDLFGELAGPDTEELRYKRQKIGNEGIASFRAAMPYLPNLKLLRLEDCGITDNEQMDALRSDFPETNVVWSVRIGGYLCMTDTDLLNCPLLRDADIETLQYLHDVKYLDVGHNAYLSNIEFVKNFPKLEVVIVTLTNIKDISPLKDCPNIEFLEMVSTGIDNIDVVAGMEKLEYLNLGCMWNLTDITPVFGLKNLKIVRICGTTYEHITRDDVEAMKEALPDSTFVSDYGGDPTTSGGWRFPLDGKGKYTERYALLRQQMLYDRHWEKRMFRSLSEES
ncbi:MAG: hypothetical protein ACSW8E_04320 [Clostridia bacterium]